MLKDDLKDLFKPDADYDKLRELLPVEMHSIIEYLAHTRKAHEAGLEKLKAMNCPQVELEATILGVQAVYASEVVSAGYKDFGEMASAAVHALRYFATQYLDALKIGMLKI